MRNLLRIALVQLALTAAAARDAQAVVVQTVASVLDCASAAQQVTAGSPTFGLGGAYATLAGCPVATAAPALAAAWSRVGPGNDDMKGRAGVSMRFADRRILNAALAAATSSARSADERTSALSTVVSLLKPGRGFTTTFWYHPQTAGQLDIIADIDVFPGEQPITAADRSAAVQALAAMASSDSDPQARLVAQRLVTLLQ